MVGLSWFGRAGAGRALLLALMLFLADAPAAHSFEIFGFKLFGSSNEEDAGVVDPVHYTATLVSEGGDGDLTDRLKSASLLVGRRDVPPSGTIGLIARARDDQANLLARLYEDARFGGVVSIVIA